MTTNHKTFDEFAAWAMQYLFDGLITGGTSLMKQRLLDVLACAITDGENKKWSKK